MCAYIRLYFSSVVKCALRRPKVSATRLFIQQLCQANTKETIKAWIITRIIHRRRIVFPHKGPVMRKVFPRTDFFIISQLCSRFVDKFCRFAHRCRTPPSQVIVQTISNLHKNIILFKYFCLSILFHPLPTSGCIKFRQFISFVKYMTTSGRCRLKLIYSKYIGKFYAYLYYFILI